MDTPEILSPIISQTAGNAQSDAVLEFLHNFSLSDVPDDIVTHARYLMLDLLGVAAAGRQTKTANIICDYAAGFMGAGTDKPAVPILFDGRGVSTAGAALAGGMIIDSMDAHDGYKPTKGHVGCALLPSIFAALEAQGQVEDEDALLAALIAGYEVGSRCGMALHRTTPDYHSSGAWMAVAVAGIVARIYRLNVDVTWHAMGIAEYHGPRSQMMRVIDNSSMLKDGSGWGAMAGISAAELAAAGFTGAPALIISDEACKDIWSELGTDWLLKGQYIKLWPVCRWAQPAMQAVCSLWQEAAFDPMDVSSIEIETFHESLRLASPHPTCSDEAQYSLCWPVAAMVIALAEERNFGAFDVSSVALGRADIHRLATRIKLVENDEFNKVFPQLRQSRVHIDFVNGNRRTAFSAHTKGDPETPLSYSEMLAKFDNLILPTPFASRATLLKRACLTPGAKHLESSWQELLFASQ